MIRLRSQNAKHRLVSLVRYGKVTPKQAEAEAAARGSSGARKTVVHGIDLGVVGGASVGIVYAEAAIRVMGTAARVMLLFRGQSNQWDAVRGRYEAGVDLCSDPKADLLL